MDPPSPKAVEKEGAISKSGEASLGLETSAIVDLQISGGRATSLSPDVGLEGVAVKAKPLVLAPNVDDGVKWKRGDVEYGSEFSAYSTWNMRTNETDAAVV
ncbi:hypothetical protein F2Q70_00043482 [Brassica cretica]|uniref:Uncharacterized protein n=1 Tax=Brassica cretica TaxID=69181 RepID=A0A8S9KGG8_BRACR|nr:hypothetical protein F2Q70_00043482 [Brassica cretica]